MQQEVEVEIDCLCPGVDEEEDAAVFAGYQ